MHDLEVFSPCFCTASQLHHTSGTLCGQDLGAGLAEVVQFFIENLRGNIRKLAGIGAAESTAGLLFFGRYKFISRCNSTTALNSTCPRRGTPLIRYLGAEVMPKCSSRARSLPVGIEASTLKDSL